jgi:hypothetical protein
LTNFPGYGSWNPFIRQIEGALIVEKRLRVFARLLCGLPMGLWPKVLGFGIVQEIRWLGNLLISGLLNGEHLFMLVLIGLELLETIRAYYVINRLILPDRPEKNF